jgi:hypothetical protein
MHTIDPAIGLNSLHQTFVEPPAQAPVRDNPGNEYAISSEGRTAVREAWGAIFRDWGYEI